MEILWVFTHQAPVVSVDWWNGVIVSLDMEGRVYIWSDTGPHIINGFKTGVVNPKVVRLSPSGRIAVGGDRISVFTSAGNLVSSYKNPSSTNDLVWISEGRILAVQNKGLVLLDVSSGKAVEVSNHRGCAFTAVDLSPEGSRFITGTCNGHVDMWFVDTLVPYRSWYLASPITDVFWTVDGKILVSTYEGVKFFNERGEEMGGITSYGTLFVKGDPKGEKVLYGGKDEIPRVFNLRRAETHTDLPFKHWISDGDWDENGIRVVVVSFDGKGRVYSVR